MNVRIEVTGSGVDAKPPRGLFVRPNVSRFKPTDFEKKLACAEWIDCDPVAQHHVEETGIVDEVYYDRHWYPTA